MPDSTVIVTKGTGTAVQYGSPNPSGLYTPQYLDRNSLTANADGSFTEVQPDGLKLIYQPVGAGFFRASAARTGMAGRTAVRYTSMFAGNPLVERTPASITTSTYDPANRLLKQNQNGALTSFAYDAYGGRTLQWNSTGRTSYTWDDDHRLKQVALPAGAGVRTYSYNAEGLRFSRQTTATAATRYVWNGQILVAETDQSNSPQVAYTQDPYGFGGLVTRYRVAANATDYPLYDALGSAAQVTSQSQVVTAQAAFDAFGKVLVAGDATLAYVARPGYYYDADLGLYYVRQRWYDPSTKQWVSPDPIEFHAGAHLYRYCGSNGIVNTDPSGTLTIVPSSPKPDLSHNNGSAIWLSGWKLKQATNAGGWIVQKISITFSVGACGCILPSRLLPSPTTKPSKALPTTRPSITHATTEPVRTQHATPTTAPMTMPSTQPSIKDCVVGVWNYWEAWPVAPRADTPGGKIYFLPDKSLTIEPLAGSFYHVLSYDTWHHMTCKTCTFGMLSWIATSAFYERAALPKSFKPDNPETLAGPLPSTTSDPSMELGDPQSDTAEHILEVAWNSCDGKDHEGQVVRQVP